MSGTIERIQLALQDLGIHLTEEIDITKKHIMPESVTNQFLKVMDHRGDEYLIRINGRLWPPFTRQDESDNLEKLNKVGVETNILWNGDGFQICRLSQDVERFSNIDAKTRSNTLLKKVATEVRKVHHAQSFQNTFYVHQTLLSAFSRLPEAQQKMLYAHFQMVMRLQAVLHFDTKNHVSAHNDLLPSSVFMSENTVKIVDWEYSGRNHRSYDLAFFAIKAGLSSFEEECLISAYDPIAALDLKYHFMMMKPVVSCLLLLWNMSSKRPADDSKALMHSLLERTQDALTYKTARTLTFEASMHFEVIEEREIHRDE